MQVLQRQRQQQLLHSLNTSQNQMSQQQHQQVLNQNIQPVDFVFFNL